jgi:hypothetical protein
MIPVEKLPEIRLNSVGIPLAGIEAISELVGATSTVFILFHKKYYLHKFVLE